MNNISEFDSALLQLKSWCELSHGKMIEITDGLNYEFHQYKTFSDQEISETEKKIGWKLPESYKSCLKQIGHAMLFVDRFGLGLDFYDLNDITQIHHDLKTMEEDQPITDQFCMIGSIRSLGDFFGFTINRDGPENFNVYCHEDPVYDYVSITDELKQWKTFDEWLMRLTSTYGKECL